MSLFVLLLLLIRAAGKRAQRYHVVNARTSNFRPRMRRRVLQRTTTWPGTGTTGTAWSISAEFTRALTDILSESLPSWLSKTRDARALARLWSNRCFAAAERCRVHGVCFGRLDRTSR